MSDLQQQRRAFLRCLSGLLGASVAAAAPAAAFSLHNPGRDAGYPRYIGQKGKRWAMVIDLRKCIGCQACAAVCKVENVVPDGKYRTYVPEYELGRYPEVRKAFLPQLCNHCADPPCVKVCPTGATYQRQDGVVVVDNTVCWGCGYCINACPYDKRYFNTFTRTADKCTLCAHRIDKGMLPACVETCVGGARVFGDVNDPASDVSRLLDGFPAAVLKPDQGTRPHAFYIGLTGEIQGLPVGSADLTDRAKALDGLKPETWTTSVERRD